MLKDALGIHPGSITFQTGLMLPAIAGTHGPGAAQESVPVHQGHLHSREQGAISITGLLPVPRAPLTEA